MALQTWPYQTEITITQGKSIFPSVTGLKDGSFIVVWTETVTSNNVDHSDIRAQVYTAAGLPKGSAFTIAASDGNERDPVVTALENGGFAVAWENRSTTSVHASVYGAGLEANGTPRLIKTFEARDPTQPPTNDHANPSLTALADGGFVLSVTGSRFNSATNVASSYVYNGVGELQNSSQFERFALTNTFRDTDTADFLINGNAAFVTVSSVEGTIPRIVAEIKTAAGALIKNELTVASLASGARTPAVSVTALGNDKFIVAWSDGKSIQAKIFNADGTVAKETFELYRFDSTQNVLIDRLTIETMGGGFALAFEQGLPDGTNSEVYVKTFDMSGVPTSSHIMPYGTMDGFQAFPSLTALADGRLVVSWTSDMKVRARILDPRPDGVNLVGTAGSDDYYGTDKDDILEGGLGSDTLSGGDGNDLFITDDVPGEGLSAADIFNGNEGSRDKVVYWYADTGAVIDLSNQDANDGAAKGDRFNSIEIIDGTKSVDRIIGDGGNNAFWGNDANDYLNGAGGDDTLTGGAGNDQLDGGAGDASVLGNDGLYGNEGDDFLAGAGGGNDTFDGGDGKDTVSYFGTTGIQLYMQTQTDGMIVATSASRGAAAGDSFKDIEVIDGTFQADTIEGTLGAQAFWGANGNDVLKGHEGNDTLKGGEDSDALFGGAGADTLDGENGFDWASYADAAGAVSASLVTGRGTVGVAAGDTFVRVEGLIGSRFNDTLAGAAHELRGGLGNDTYQVGAGAIVTDIKGGGRDTVLTSVSFTLSSSQEIEVLTATGSANVNLKGNSIANAITGNAKVNKIWGGLGNDQLKGGAGKDYFVFNTKANTKTNKDAILDFSTRDDTVWFDNAVFTKLGRAGTETRPAKLSKDFFVLGSKAKDKNDYVIYDKGKGVLSYDADGSGKGAAVVVSTFTKKPGLTLADFFVI